jgi:cation diffusion facilitator family transporter
MQSCCEQKDSVLIALRKKQGKILKIVLALNLTMFFVEFGMGWIARSTSLLGDSLDMLGDSLMYGLTLFVLHRSAKAKAKVAFFKGIVLGAFGAAVIVEAFFKIITDVIPSSSTMGWVGLMALAANTACFLMLYGHRESDLNMKSVYLCSRNDIISNFGVIVVSFLVSYFNSKWPDIILGVIIASLFLQSAFSIIKESIPHLKHGH